ncbi:MAG: hypothetical protein NXI31_20940 [bacterium]|nr:hypothetical protein [bacterium]
MIAAVTLAALLLPALPTTAGHPFHNAYAEVDCHQKRQELQVAMAVLGVDLEATLTQRTGKRINLDRTKGIDEILEDYLADRFLVTLTDGTKPRPRYFGREDAGKTVWLYFTVPLAKAPTRSGSPTGSRQRSRSLLTGVQLENRVLMELYSCQRNTVELREGPWRRVLQFDERRRRQTLRPSKQPGNKGQKRPVKKEPIKKGPAPKKGARSTGSRRAGTASPR